MGIGNDVMKKLYGQGGQNPLYPPPDPNDPNAAKPTPTSPPPTDPSQPPSGTIAQAMPPAQSPVQPPATSTIPTQSEFAAQNPGIEKQYMPPRPVGPFDKLAEGQPGADSWGNRHNDLRRALATMFAGIGEFGKPGSERPFFENMSNTDAAQRQYDNPQNQERMKSGAISTAYNQSLNQSQERANIQKTQSEVAAAHAPERNKFLGDAQNEVKSGRDPQEVFNEYAPRAGTAFVNRSELLDAVNSAHSTVPRYSVITGEGGRPEGLRETKTNRQFGPTQIPNDPEAQTAWSTAQSGHEAARGEKLADEEKVAGFAADRQAQAFTNAQTAEGRKVAGPHLEAVNEAKGQQALIENLLGGKMSPAAQTTAVYKLVGLQQPKGAHRVMPAEVQGWKQLGGWSDRAAQWFANAKAGDQFPPELLPDIVSTAKKITQNSIKTANDNLQSNFRNTGYKVPGTDENGRLDKPTDYEDSGGGQGGTKQPQGATHTGIGSQDKKKHWLDAQGNDLGLAE